MRDLSLHLLDIMQNSVAAGAGVIEVSLLADDGMLVMVIEDNGCGMDSEFLKRVTDPFYTTRTTRKIGLGIPLLKASAERASGGLAIDSQPGSGTKVRAYFDVGNIDRPPLGDMAGTITGMILANPEILLRLKLKSFRGEFTLDTGEIRDKLGEVPIIEFEVLEWIRDYVEEGVTAIFGGVLNEVDSGTGRDKEENP